MTTCCDVFGSAEEIRDGFAVDVLHAVLERLGALGVVVGHAGVVLQALDGHEDLVGGVAQQGGHALHVGGRLDLEDLHLADRAVAVVEDIVDGAGEGEDILAVERRDEGLVELIDQDAAGLIGCLFLGVQQGRGLEDPRWPGRS